MRHSLLRNGVSQLDYEIRAIVQKADQLKTLGKEIILENIGDPVQKQNEVPLWIREIVSRLAMKSESYGYTHSKGEPTTRAFLAQRNNERGGVQITQEDILFFNGLGDAISKVYQYLTPTARVIGPSPAYATHSSAEAAHANDSPITYLLNPNDRWRPDIEDLRLKITYNTNIVGILVINPDNPTGMVYKKETLLKIVALAKSFNLFLIFDEVYANICYDGAKTTLLSQIIGEVPGISMKGISKEMPWPGSRCGWMEFYNRDKSKDFNNLCATLENAKMLEVCATKLPQIAIPIIMSDKRYPQHLVEQSNKIQQRGVLITKHLKNCKGIKFNTTNGSFFNTIVFDEAQLKPNASIAIKDPKVQVLLDEWCYPGMTLDRKFAYYLMASTGVCVVPISSFCSKLLGFRITLLENDEKKLITTLEKIKYGLQQFIG